ncbi:hypothetical protein QLX08_011668 [Tetragonisca angustula]|uniref:Uncharacterized protein n=1 Tax=Tetragonisca angustula TaxID=166442 RepID=A0AAW0Z7D2_9HYME
MERKTKRSETNDTIQVHCVSRSASFQGRGGGIKVRSVSRRGSTRWTTPLCYIFLSVFAKTKSKNRVNDPSYSENSGSLRVSDGSFREIRIIRIIKFVREVKLNK